MVINLSAISTTTDIDFLSTVHHMTDSHGQCTLSRPSLFAASIIRFHHVIISSDLNRPAWHLSRSPRSRNEKLLTVTRTDIKAFGKGPVSSKHRVSGTPFRCTIRNTTILPVLRLNEILSVSKASVDPTPPPLPPFSFCRPKSRKFQPVFFLL